MSAPPVSPSKRRGGRPRKTAAHKPEAKRGRGRPFKSDDERRDAPRIAVKVTQAERDALEGAAAAAGKDFTVWCREVMLRAAKRV